VRDDAHDFEVVSAADDVAERPVHGGCADLLGDVQRDDNGALRHAPRPGRVGLLDHPDARALHLDQTRQRHVSVYVDTRGDTTAEQNRGGQLSRRESLPYQTSMVASHLTPNYDPALRPSRTTTSCSSIPIATVVRSLYASL
jgi:hypothetical protein